MGVLEERILNFTTARFSSQLSKEERAAAKSELRDIVLKASLDDCKELLSKAVREQGAKVRAPHPRAPSSARGRFAVRTLHQALYGWNDRAWFAPTHAATRPAAGMLRCCP